MNSEYNQPSDDAFLIEERGPEPDKKKNDLKNTLEPHIIEVRNGIKIMSPGPESDELRFDYRDPAQENINLDEVALHNFLVDISTTQLSKEQQIELIGQAMEELGFSKIQKEIIILTLENKTLEQIAEILAPITPARKIKNVEYKAGTPLVRERIRQIQAKCIRRLIGWHKRYKKS